MKLTDMTANQLGYIRNALAAAFDACREEYSNKLDEMRASGAPSEDWSKVSDQRFADLDAIRALQQDVADAEWLWHYRNTPKAASILDTLPGADGKTSQQRNEERAADIIARLG